MAVSVVKFCYNGSEYRFVSKDPAQIEDLQCPVCFELAYEPVLTHCGHLFCRGCVRGQRSCPTCRSKLRYMRNQRDERKVKRLRVECPNWEKGCEWQGDLGDTAQHTGTNCQMEAVPCPKGCNEKVLRGLLGQHAFTCARRPYTCQHCGFEDAHTDITSVHFTACGEFPLICPAGCCKHLTRSKMAEHLAVCEEELVLCKYAAIGCTEEVMKRKDLQTHLQDKKDYHLERAMDVVVQYNMVLAEATRGVRCGISHTPISFRPWLQNMPTCFPRPPWVIKLEGFNEKKKKNEVQFSDPVYSHFGGYKMCLRVDANGGKEGKGTHVSVFAYLMQGDNDDNLKWPFNGTIKVSLLNQLENGQHHTITVWSPDIPGETRVRVTKEEKVVPAWGVPQFIPQQDLSLKGNKNRQYLKDNTLFFRVDCFKPAQ